MTAADDYEVLPSLDVDAARRLDERIRLTANAAADNIAELGDLVAEAKAGQIHVALGFVSWTAYLADALQALKLAVKPAERRELVDRLSYEGMSERAMARALGCSQPTIHRDRVPLKHGAR